MADDHDQAPPPPEDQEHPPRDAADAAPDAQAEIAPDTEPGPDAAAQRALDAAEAAVSSLRGDAEDSDVDLTASVSPESGTGVDLPEFGGNGASGQRNGLDLLSQVNLNVRIELGRTQMLVEDVLRLNEGAVVELDKLAGDPVDVYVNDRHVATGEVLVLNESFCVRISEILARPGLVSRKTTVPDSAVEDEQVA